MASDAALVSSAINAAFSKQGLTAFNQALVSLDYRQGTTKNQ